MTNTARSVLLLILGLGMEGATWYMALNQGSFYMILCVAGPALIVLGLASLVLPLDKLYQRILPNNADNDASMVQNVAYNYEKMTGLGWFIVLVGVGLGLLQMILLQNGGL